MIKYLFLWSNITYPFMPIDLTLRTNNLFECWQWRVRWEMLFSNNTWEAALLLKDTAFIFAKYAHTELLDKILNLNFQWNAATLCESYLLLVIFAIASLYFQFTNKYLNIDITHVYFYDFIYISLLIHIRSMNYTNSCIRFISKWRKFSNSLNVKFLCSYLILTIPVYFSWNSTKYIYLNNSSNKIKENMHLFLKKYTVHMTHNI